MRLTIFAICAALLAANDPALAGPAVGASGVFTAEERFLYLREQQGLNWHDLSRAQRCERMGQMRRARQAMNSTDVAKLKQRLDAEWKAIPAAEQQRIEQRIAERRARRAQKPGERRAPACASVNGGRSP